MRISHFTFIADRLKSCSATSHRPNSTPSFKHRFSPAKAIVWLGAPDVRYPVYHDAKDEVVRAVAAILFAAGILYVFIVELSEGKVGFDLGALLSWVLLISTCPLTIVGIIALIRFRRNRPSKLPPYEPPVHVYAITNKRVLVYAVHLLSTTSIALENIEIDLESLKRGYGNLAFYPYSKKFAPVRARSPVSAFAFEFIPDAAKVYHLARETQAKLIED